MKKGDEPDDGPTEEDEELVDPEKPIEDVKNPYKGGFKPSLEDDVPRSNIVVLTPSCGSVEQPLEEVSAKPPAFNKKAKNATAVPFYEDKPKVDEMEGKKLTLLKKMAAAEKKKPTPPPAKNKRKKRKKKEPVKESAREKKPKESKVVKKTLGDRLKDKFKAVTSFFAPGVQEKAQKKVQAKLSAPRASLKKIADGDDAMPTAAIKQPQPVDKDGDVWIEDPAVLTDRQHRPDLVIILNQDNSGHLWHDGKRPFWKNKAYLNEIPVAPAENPVSKLLMDVVTNKTPLAEPAPEPVLDEVAPVEELAGKDARWFQEEQVMSNTIRSIVCTLNESSNSAEVAMATGGLKKLTVIEPTTTTTYYRHNLAQKETVPFSKSPFGKPKKIRAKMASPVASPVASSSTTGSGRETAANAKVSGRETANKGSGRETAVSAKDKRGAKKK